ncbi:hypothetical protein NBRC10512v2_001431 [Rhodotorula toruloides]
MSLMPSTSSPTPAHAPPPPDERIPLSSMPDLTKFVPPLIQDAIENELDREDGGGYYDEFEQLYWTYSGWDEVREKFERDWDPLMDWVRDYSQRRFVAMGSMDRDAQKGLMMEYAELAPKFKFANLCRRGPAGLAILRRRYFDRNPCVGSTTTYVFPVPPQAPFPPNVAAYSPLSFASLVPSPSQTVQQAGQREPGLAVVSSVGTVRFWESVSLSLSGVDRFKSASCPLNEGELVKDLKLVSPTTYLLSTTQSRLFAINIISHAGRADLSVRPLERSLGWAGSVWSAVFGSKTVDPRAGILALALSQPQPNEAERTVYAVMEKNVQVWKVPVRSEGGERLLVEQDIFAGVLEALAGEKIGNEQRALNEGKVEIVDAAVTASGHLAVLISHVHDGTASDSLSFAIVMLEVGTLANSVAVAGLTHLAYQSRPDPRPLSTPRLSLGSGEIAFVVFAGAVVIASIAHDPTF